MNRKATNNSAKKELPDKLNTIWAAIIAGCTLLSMGFGTGFYISNILNKIEINEVNQKHNEQLYDQKKNFDNKVEELIHEKHLLEIENGRLRKK